MELKDQLEDIQKRVEDEIQAGIPPVRLTEALMYRCVGIFFSDKAVLKHATFNCMVFSSNQQQSVPSKWRSTLC